MLTAERRQEILSRLERDGKVVASELARRVGLRTPTLVELDLDPEIARYEADEEVQDLLNASPGANLGIDFLPGAFGVDGQLDVPAEEAARVLWLDAFIANVDRSWRNPNLLLWHDDLWVIDHGASLYFHHGWRSGVSDPGRFAAQPWDAAGHVFEDRAPLAVRLDDAISAVLGAEVFAEVLEAVPDVWLEPVPGAESAEALREAYVGFLTARLATRTWLPGGGT